MLVNVVLQVRSSVSGVWGLLGEEHFWEVERWREF